MSAVCRFIHAEKAHYTIVLLCRVMKTARSTYYAWVAGAEAVSYTHLTLPTNREV